MPDYDNNDDPWCERMMDGPVPLPINIILRRWMNGQVIVRYDKTRYEHLVHYEAQKDLITFFYKGEEAMKICTFPTEYNIITIWNQTFHVTIVGESDKD